MTEKQKRFVDEYIIDLNATRAYRAVYLKCKTDASAAPSATRLLQNAEIQEAIQKQQQKLKDKFQLTQEMVIREYMKLGFVDPRNLFNEDGTPKDISELDDETAAAISGLDVQEVFEGKGANKRFAGYVKKYKLSDKKGALDSLARHLGLFNDKVKVEGEINVNSPREEITRRVARIATRIGEEQSS